MRNKGSDGFTIIEVVLVLAIAGLIFMIVFLALPQLQRSQRDTQRKNDLGLFNSALLNYSRNNNLKLPNSGNIDQFANQYFSEYRDPSTGDPYDVVYHSVSADVEYPEAGEIYIDTSNAVCTAGSHSTTTSNNSSFSYADPSDPSNTDNRQYAIAIGLEQGYFCIDNTG